eukprot:6202678-Pleurochrysis_carterae.AAC.1
MATAVTALECASTRGAGERALAAAARAIRRARRAGDEALGGISNTRPARNFTSMGPADWNRCGGQSLFMLATGGVVFTGARDVVRGPIAEEAVESTVFIWRVGGGEPEAVPVAQLLALSDGVLPGVLSVGGARAGEPPAAELRMVGGRLGGARATAGLGAVRRDWIRAPGRRAGEGPGGHSAVPVGADVGGPRRHGGRAAAGGGDAAGNGHGVGR